MCTKPKGTLTHMYLSVAHNSEEDLYHIHGGETRVTPWKRQPGYLVKHTDDMVEGGCERLLHGMLAVEIGQVDWYGTEEFGAWDKEQDAVDFCEIFWPGFLEVIDTGILHDYAREIANKMFLQYGMGRSWGTGIRRRQAAANRQNSRIIRYGDDWKKVDLWPLRMQRLHAA